LQDVHWALGEFGYFPTYALGNIYAAQLVDAYERERNLDDELNRGDLGSLRSWLALHVYGRGAELPAETVMTQVVGRGLDVEPFFARLERRVAELE
jgi:carboxypeptidase Taq